MYGGDDQKVAHAKPLGQGVVVGDHLVFILKEQGLVPVAAVASASSTPAPDLRVGVVLLEEGFDVV